MLRNTHTLAGALALALGATLLMVGCKSDSESGGGSGLVNAGGELKADAKVLYYFRASAHKTLDPMKQFDAASADIVNNVYDTLLNYHYLKRPYQLNPNLVEEIPTLSEDGLTYTFKLRKGIKFIDDACFPGGKGRELKADDVIYSIKRFSDTKVNTISYPVFLNDRIEGLDAFREKTRTATQVDYAAENIPGIQKVDDYTFTLKLVRKDPLLLMSFAASPLSIVPKEAVDKYGEELERHPVGTGPFYVKEYSRRGKLVLAKNPNYHGVYPSEGEAGDKENGLLKNAGQKLPLIDEVHLPLIEEPQPAMLKFLSGQIDWIGLDKDNFIKMAYKDDKGGFHLKDEYAKKFTAYTETALSTDYVVFNMKDPLLGQNKALRQAFAYAVNTPGFIDKMRNGRGVTLNSVVPLPIAGSERDTGARWYSHDTEMAKKKLEEAGFPNGEGLPEFTIEYRATDSGTRQVFEFHRNEFAKAGIKVKGNFQTFSAFLKKVEAGAFQIASAGWAADYPDAENFYQLLYGPNLAPGPNEGSYANAEYDKLYEQTKVMVPSPERNAIFKQMADMLYEDAPFISPWVPISFGMHQGWVGNLKRNMMIDAPYQYLDIDLTKKKLGVPK